MKKTLICSIMLLFILTANLSLVSSQVITLDEWNKVKDEDAIRSAFVFSLYLHSWFETDHLENNEFLFGDIIDYCHISILIRKPQDLAIKATKIIFTSPSKEKYERNLSGKDDIFYAGQFTYSIEEALVHLNESGLWSVTLIFNNSYPYPLIYSGDSKFTNSSEIHIFRGLNINVYTNLEYQQLRAAKAMEESAKTAKDSAFWSKIAAIFLFIASLAAVATIIFNLWRHKEEKKEKIRAKKEEYKHIASDCLIDIRFLISETKNLLDSLKSHNYHYQIPGDEHQKYEKIKKRFHELRQKLISCISYVTTSPEAEEISSELDSIFIDYIAFINTSLERISSPTTKEDVEKANEELDKLEESVKKFLLRKIE